MMQITLKNNLRTSKINLQIEVLFCILLLMKLLKNIELLDVIFFFLEIVLEICIIKGFFFIYKKSVLSFF